MNDGTILIVDDEVLIRELIVNMLSDSGQYRLLEASNGKEALEICKKDSVDLVFTDLRMPVMEGMEFLAHLHKLKYDIPVVILTGYGQRDDVIEALRLGASNFLLKPQEVNMVRPIASKILRMRVRERLEKQVYNFFVEESQKFQITNELRYTLPVIDQITNKIDKIGVCDSNEVMNIRLALDEALVNAIIHGNLEIKSVSKGVSLDNLVEFNNTVLERSTQPPYSERVVIIRSRLNTKGVEFEVEDQGNGFNWRQTPNNLDDIELLANHGRGLLLIKAFMSEVTFNEKGNCIKMVKHREN